MSVIVCLPSTLRLDGPESIVVAHADTIDEIIQAIDERFPGVGAELSRPDSGFNFAVNDEMLLSGVRTCRLKDGDRVEIVPALAGG